MSPNGARAKERIADLLAASLLAPAALYWSLTLSHLPPGKLSWLLSGGLAIAVVGLCLSRPILATLSILLASACSALMIACCYRLPRSNSAAPWLSLESLPLGGLWLAILTAAALAVLWGRWTRWLGLDDGRRFVVFLLGAAPLLAVAVDLFFLGKAPLQPLRPPAYHPYLTYAAQHSYGFSHARESEVVDLRGVRFSQQKPAGVTRLVLCGASTTWGQGLSAKESLSHVLQAKLEEEQPDREFEVLTVAFPGKYQLNELIDAVVTIPHWDPDIVISMNGFNEVWYGEETNRYEGMPYIEAQMRTRGTLSCLATRFSHLGAVYFANSQSERTSPYQLKEDNHAAAPRYYQYLESTAANLKRQRIVYAHAFCPNVQEKLRRSPAESRLLANGDDWIGQVAERRKRSQAIVRRQQQIVFDVMRPLANQEETLFLDECHLNARGVELVAAEIVRLLPSWLEASALPKENGKTP